MRINPKLLDKDGNIDCAFCNESGNCVNRNCPQNAGMCRISFGLDCPARVQRGAVTVLDDDLASEKRIADDLNLRYTEIQNDAKRLFERMMRFGAAVAAAELELEWRGLLGDRRNGQGMRAWLARHCPGVAYETAMRWRRLAVDAAQTMGCDEQTALAVLAGNVDACPPEAPVAEIRAEAEEILAAGSAPKLNQMLFGFAGIEKGKPGRPAGTAKTPTVERVTPVDSARRMWAEFTRGIAERRGAFVSAAALLPADEARITLDELNLLRDALTKRVKEG